MSTSSGLRPGVRDSRRSIDVVQHIQGDEYRFIELKVGSGQPLYATFEILGYGLLYLLARQHGRRGDGTHDVMVASRIELVVLGPDSWFRYKESTGGPVSRFDFEWLQGRINEGLAAEVRARRCHGLNEITLRFVVFPDTPTIEDDVTAIEALFSPELRTLNLQVEYSSHSGPKGTPAVGRLTSAESYTSPTNSERALNSGRPSSSQSASS
jgi:hypothetical protein